MTTRFNMTLECGHRVRKQLRQSLMPTLSKMYYICVNGCFCRRCGERVNGMSIAWKSGDIGVFRLTVGGK